MMTHDDFDRVFEALLSHVRNLLLTKSDEYSRDGDKNHNFKDHSAISVHRGCTQLESAHELRNKHTVSIRDMIRDLRIDKHHPIALWLAKYGDEIAYRFLEFGILHEEEGWPVGEEGTTTTGVYNTTTASSPSPAPPHSNLAIPPGEYLREVMDDQEWTPGGLRARLSPLLPRETINDVFAGRAAITTELAHGLEEVLNVPCNVWLGLEATYRTVLAREHEKEHAAKGGRQCAST